MRLAAGRGLRQTEPMAEPHASDNEEMGNELEEIQERLRALKRDLALRKAVHGIESGEELDGLPSRCERRVGPPASAGAAGRRSPRRRRRQPRRRRARPPRRAARGAQRRSARRPAAAAAPAGCRARSISRRGSATPAPAHATRAAFSAMSPAAGHATHRHAARQRAHQRAVPGVASPRRRRAASSARRRASPRAARWAARRAAAAATRRLVGGEHPHRLAGEPLERGAQHALLGVLGGRGSHQHQRVVAGRQLDVLVRRLPQQRPGDARPRHRLPARVLELRERGHERQLRARCRRARARAAAGPTRRRVSLSSSRPCSTPAAHERVDQRATAAARARVRGSRAPIE